MASLREILPHIDMEMAEIPYDRLLSMDVRMEHFIDALKEIEPSAIREVFVEVPDVTWADVGGLEDIKDELRDAVQWPLQHPDVFEKYDMTPTKGILLHGPSGTGKTLLAKALARESGVNFISVKGPELMSKYVGESERAIREVFRTAKQASPSILYFDEIESLVPVRGRDSGAGASFTERVISQFLAEMNGIEELRGVIVLATTNRIDLVDPSLLAGGRFDLVMELPMPDEEARRRIFAIHLLKKPVSPDVNTEELARKSSGFSGGDIAFVCRKAAMLALREALKSGGEVIPLLEWRHFDSAMEILGRHEQIKTLTGF